MSSQEDRIFGKVLGTQKYLFIHPIQFIFSQLIPYSIKIMLTLISWVLKWWWRNHGNKQLNLILAPSHALLNIWKYWVVNCRKLCLLTSYRSKKSEKMFHIADTGMLSVSMATASSSCDEPLNNLPTNRYIIMASWIFPENFNKIQQILFILLV